MCGKLSEKPSKYPLSLIRFARLELPRIPKLQSQHPIAKVYSSFPSMTKRFFSPTSGDTQAFVFISAEKLKKAKMSAFSKINFQLK